MKHWSFLVLAVTVAAAGLSRRTPAAAPEVTFTRDVAPIIHANCVRFLRPG